MTIRRRSDATRPVKRCAYHEQMQHERTNQDTHRRRQHSDSSHDPLSLCWCCCDCCTDLTWYPIRQDG